MSKKISELDQVNDLYQGCCFPLVQNEETKKVTYETLKNKIIEDSDNYFENKIDTKIVNKVDKVPGKGLTTNDFTDEYKNKLENKADLIMLHTDWEHIYRDKDCTQLLTFDDIKELTNDNTKLVTLYNGNYVLRPEYAYEKDGVEAIWFNGVTSLNGKPYIYRVIINSNEQLSSDEYELAQTNEIPKKTSDLTNDSGFINQHQDITGKEDKSNKVTTITSESTDAQYPSAKAVYQELAELKAESNEEQEDLIEDLYKALYVETVESENEELVLKNAMNVRAKQSTIYGKTNQVTTKGYQLVDFANLVPNSNTQSTFINDVLTVKSLGGGSSTGTPTCSSSGYYEVTDTIKNNAGKTVKFSYKSIDISKFTSTNNSIVQYIVNYNDGTSTLYKQLVTRTSDTEVVTYSVDIPSDTTNISKVTFRVFANNISTVVDTGEVSITEPMLYFDDENAVYEPYTGAIASPNGQYPQEMENLKGYNLFDFETYKENQPFNIIGTEEEFTVKGIGTNEYTLNNTKQITISGSWSTTNLNGQMRVVYDDDTYDSVFNSYANTIASGDIAFTSKKNKTPIKINTTMYNATNDITFKNFQITNSITPTIYAKHGYINMSLLSKNVNKNNIKTALKTIDSSGKIIDSVTGKYLGFDDLMEVEPNTTYYVQFLDMPSYPSKIYFGEYTSSKKYITKTTVSSGYIITTGNSTKYIFLYYYKNTADYYNDYAGKDIMLERGNTYSIYEPYKGENHFTIDLKGNELRKVGTIADKLIVDRKGYVAIEKHVNEVKFDGTENMIYSDIQHYRYTVGVSNMILTSSSNDIDYCIKSNKFVSSSNQITYRGTSTYQIHRRLNQQEIMLQFEPSISTTGLAKQWLADNTPIVMYPLETPTIINLGKQIAVETLRGYNYIRLETSLGSTDFEIEYVEDLDSRIKNIENRLALLEE